MIAVFRAGAVWQPVHPRNALTENIDFLNDNGAEYVFYHSRTAADAAEFKTKVASLKGMTCLDLADDNGPSLETWAARYPEIFPEDEHGASDLAWVKATGGTTGRSKSSMISHRAATSLFTAFHWCMPLPEGHITLAATPLTHAAGNVSLCTISNGGTIVFLDKADPAAIVDAIERHGITTMFLPPTVIYSLLTMPDIRKRNFSFASLFYLHGGTDFAGQDGRSSGNLRAGHGAGLGAGRGTVAVHFHGPGAQELRARNAVCPRRDHGHRRQTPRSRRDRRNSRTHRPRDGTAISISRRRPKRPSVLAGCIPATSATATTKAFSISLIATKT